MPLKSIEIKGFRGFKNKCTIQFAIPDNHHEGSGMTIITGANNAGKSSIIECIKARAGHQSPSFTVGMRNRFTEEVEIAYKFKDNEDTIKSVRKGSSETHREINKRDKHIYVVPSRRAFSPYFGKQVASKENYINNYSLQPQRTQQLQGFEIRLFNMEKNPDNFNRVLKQVLSNEFEWSIDCSDQGQYFLKYISGDVSHTSDGMGEGIISIFTIVDALYDSNPGDIIVIDEPELSLHPSVQKKLSKLLAFYSKDRQIIFTTHSPYFVNLEYLSNGCEILRIKGTIEGSQVFSLSDESKSYITQLAKGNLYNPHVFGTTARELFFLDDNIILTEGQEDVLLYPEIAKQLNEVISGDFFGWGAGGADNISKLCKILCDFGYDKVFTIFDADKKSICEEMKVKYPSYMFFCIEAEDVRTKPYQKERSEKKGLLDEKLSIRDEYKESTKDIFTNLNTYFRS